MITFTPPKAEDRGLFFKDLLAYRLATPEDAAKYLLGSDRTDFLLPTPAFHAACHQVYEGLLERLVIPCLNGHNFDADWELTKLQDLDLSAFSLKEGLSRYFADPTLRNNITADATIAVNRWVALLKEVFTFGVWYLGSRYHTEISRPCLPEGITVGDQQFYGFQQRNGWFPEDSASITIGTRYPLNLSSLLAAGNAYNDTALSLVHSDWVSDSGSYMWYYEPTYGLLWDVLAANVQGVDWTHLRQLINNAEELPATPRRVLDLLWACQALLGLFDSTFIPFSGEASIPAETTRISRFYTIPFDGMSTFETTTKTTQTTLSGLHYYRGVSYSENQMSQETRIALRLRRSDLGLGVIPVEEATQEEIASGSLVRKHDLSHLNWEEGFGHYDDSVYPSTFSFGPKNSVRFTFSIESHATKPVLGSSNSIAIASDNIPASQVIDAGYVKSWQLAVTQRVVDASYYYTKDPNGARAYTATRTPGDPRKRFAVQRVNKGDMNALKNCFQNLFNETRSSSSTTPEVWEPPELFDTTGDAIITMSGPGFYVLHDATQAISVRYAYRSTANEDGSVSEGFYPDKIEFDWDNYDVQNAMDDDFIYLFYRYNSTLTCEVDPHPTFYESITVDNETTVVGIRWNWKCLPAEFS